MYAPCCLNDLVISIYTADLIQILILQKVKFWCPYVTTKRLAWFSRKL